MEITKTEEQRRMVFARQEAAKAWCTESTKTKIMDTELAQAFAEILVVHMYEPHLGCATTGQLLEEIKAQVDLDYTTIGHE